MPGSFSTAFVTGGTGFVGSHLVEELLSRGTSVRALVRSKPKWLSGLEVETIPGGLHDADALRRGLEGADLVVHVAGLTRARDQETLDWANVQGTRNVLEAARDAGAPRVVVTSSLEALGPNVLEDGQPVPATETDPLRPISMYGVSKARMEDVIRRDFSDLGVTVVRPPAVYGPREADLFEMVKGASRGLFPVVGDATAPRLSMVYVEDLVRGMADLAASPDAKGETYFVGSPGYAWSEVRAALEAALGRRALEVKVPAPLILAVGAIAERVGARFGALPPLTHDKAEAARHTWICDSSKAREAVGYGLEVGLAEG
ncbi:NAD-dependent epimerase/dehydratase family protein, partial [Rubrivirga sp.]|uniref:NAD-dependent epimerase/dehydratase family protein n=1 Tax=Rubrivirga sp. TaxID=1885344 RepID=UPI003C729BED